MTSEQLGTCATCKHFEATTDDELRGEVLRGEHPDYRSPGTCCLGAEDGTHGADSCPDYDQVG